MKLRSMTHALRGSTSPDVEHTLSPAVFRLIIGLCWAAGGIGAAVLVLTHASPWAWDARVYADAMRSLRLGHDPYADGIAVQRRFHGTPASHDLSVTPPYTYVYSALTLPLLRLLDLAPLNWVTTVYCLLYIAAVIAIAYACLSAVEPRERHIFAFFGALSPFFPGLLLTNVVLSGNIVYVLYAAVLCCAVLGWCRGAWWPFYMAVLLASCFKAPLLTLVLVPVLCARRQIVAAAATSGIGLLFFAMQPLLWPSLFQNYLEAVDLQFAFNRDFGFSPSGLLGHVLYRLQIAYTAPCLWFYLLYASGVLFSLAWMARRYLKGQISLTGWIPVMLIGVVLLNPRIKEYDVAPLSLPIALVLWRLLARGRSFRWTAIQFAAIFLAMNLLVYEWPQLWEAGGGLLLAGSYALGSWDLLRQSCSKPVSGASAPPFRRQEETNVPA